MSWMAVADVNGDGKPDLLVSNQDGGSNGEGSAGVLLNNGDGTFKPVQIYSSGGLQADFVAVADVNGDGKPDLLVVNLANCNNCSGSVGVLLGNGEGTFQPVVTYDAPSFDDVLVVADLNGDGKLDLVLNGGGAFNGGIFSVMLGNGNGTFQPPVTYSAGGDYNGPPMLIDLNGDHKLDIVIPVGACDSHGFGCVGVLLGNGDGTFQSVVTYTTGAAGTMALAAGDLNGDAIPDLVAISQCSTKCAIDGAISVFTGNGDGTFQPKISYDPGGKGSTWVGTADVNRDGKLDILAVNTNASSPVEGLVGVLINVTAGSTETSTSITSSLNPSVVGQAVTFTAAVSSSAGAPPNGETITFKNGSSILGTAPLSAGTASLTTSSLAAGIYTITASYPGDATFAASTSPGLRQVVNSTTKSATATTLVSSLNPSAYGQSVTWTATVTTSGSVPPTGKVNFTWSSYTIGSATLNASGVATLTKSNLNADTYPLTAVYVGDASNLGSTSSVVSQVVTQATSSAALTSSPNPSTSGQLVTFTATITSPTAKPTGPVTFAVGKTVLGTAQLSGGKAQFTTSTLTVGSTTVTATYYGDSNIAKSFAAVTQTVSSQGTLTEPSGKLPLQSKTTLATSGCRTTTTLTTSGSPTVVGQQATFSAQVYAPELCDNHLQGSCTEQITFYDGNTVIGTAPLNLSSCIATFADTSLTAKTHKIRAQFPGTGLGDLPSNSNVVTQVVTGDSTTTSLSSSLSPSIYGQPVTWTAAVTSPFGYVTPPTGRVNLMWDGQAIGAATLNASGVATLTKSLLSANSYMLTAVYEGDANNASSTSAVLSQVIGQATSSATLSSSANPSSLGQAVTFTAKITSPTVKPTGPVTFTAGQTVLGTAQLLGGKAQFTTSTLAGGSTTVTATYNGDSNIGESSASVTQTVH